MIIDKPSINRAAECHQARVQERISAFAPLIRRILRHDETLGMPHREGDRLVWPIVPTDAKAPVRPARRRRRVRA